jgi:glycosyltransferase involved in cell wall biosynthesis
LIESVKDLDIKLFIAGGGSLETEAKKMVKDLNLESKVTFLGKLSQGELAKFYKEADVLVAPSLRIEGFPMSIVEGMAYYLPIIATKIGGNDDAVFSSRNGFLINPNDPEELYERIRFFELYPEKIKQFGLSSRSLAEQKFNLDIMKKNYLEVINSLI